MLEAIRGVPKSISVSPLVPVDSARGALAAALRIAALALASIGEGSLLPVIAAISIAVALRDADGVCAPERDRLTSAGADGEIEGPASSCWTEVARFAADWGTVVAVDGEGNVRRNV